MDRPPKTINRVDSLIRKVRASQTRISDEDENNRSWCCNSTCHAAQITVISKLDGADRL